MKICERCLVHGRVQGVFFRAATREEAQKSGVNGYARNLPDGKVEVVLYGHPDAVGHMKAWLWQGPPAAHVSDVSCQLVEEQGYDDFTVS